MMKLENIYNTIITLRACAPHLRYIDVIDMVLQGGTREQAEGLISELVQVYNKDLREIGYIANRPVTQKQPAQDYYDVASDDDVVQDLLYLRACIIAIAGKRMGLIANYKEVAKELNI